ncbi:MAG: GntR family transcriptional regulator [Pseudonocardia sp.]
MPESAEPDFPYHRVAAAIRDAVTDGHLEPGQRIESEWALAERHRTSRPTIRRAIALLKAEGILVTAQGRGTFVRPPPPVQITLTAANFRRHRATGQPGFNAQVREQGLRPAQRLVDVAEAPAPPDVARRLGLAAGDPVVVRTRLFLVEDLPVARCDSYFDVRIARGTAVAERRLVRGGATAVVEDLVGPARRSLDEVSARMPTAAERADLRLAAGSPIVRVLRTLHADERPIEVQETIAAAERHTFHYEVDLG